MDPELERVEEIILHRGKEGNLVQMPCDQVIQHCVSKELKPLIAVSEPVRIVGGVRKCLQKGLVFKSFPEQSETWRRKHLSRQT